MLGNVTKVHWVCVRNGKRQRPGCPVADASRSEHTQEYTLPEKTRLTAKKHYDNLGSNLDLC